MDEKEQIMSSNYTYKINGILLITLVSILTWLSPFYEQAIAGVADISNPIDRQQPWVSGVNPAIVSSQDACVSIGLKVFHFGFLPDQSLGLHESHINASFPFYLPLNLGIGCDLRYYAAGNFSEFIGSILLSRKLVGQMAVGVKLGFIGIGFSRENFKLVQENDPLLTGSLGKSSLNLGFGIFWNPGRFTLGLGVDHLNQPDIGLKTAARLPLEISTALGYQYGKLLPAIMMQNDGTTVSYGMSLSIRHERVGLFRFSYQNTMPIKMELQFNLSRKSSLHYGYDLPTADLQSVSMGSHELAFQYIIAREPDIAQPELLISTNSLKILQEKIVRTMPADMAPGQVERIENLAPGYLDSKGRNQNMLIVPSGNLSPYETKKIRFQRYAELEKEIVRTLALQPGIEIVLSADDKTIGDAREFKKYLLNNGRLAAKEIKIGKINNEGQPKLTGFQPGRSMVTQKPPTFSSEHLTVRFQVPGKTRRLQNYKFLIMDEQKNIIRVYKGKEELVDQLAWDWKNQFGEVVAPGTYHCFLQIQALSGKEIKANSQPIQVTRVERTVAIRFKNEAELQYSKGNE